MDAVQKRTGKMDEDRFGRASVGRRQTNPAIIQKGSYEALERMMPSAIAALQNGLNRKTLAINKDTMRFTPQNPTINTSGSYITPGIQQAAFNKAANDYRAASRTNTSDGNIMESKMLAGSLAANDALVQGDLEVAKQYNDQINKSQQRNISNIAEINKTASANQAQRDYVHNNLKAMESRTSEINNKNIEDAFKNTYGVMKAQRMSNYNNYKAFWDKQYSNLQKYGDELAQVQLGKYISEFKSIYPEYKDYDNSQIVALWNTDNKYANYKRKYNTYVVNWDKNSNFDWDLIGNFAKQHTLWSKDWDKNLDVLRRDIVNAKQKIQDSFNTANNG